MLLAAAIAGVVKGCRNSYAAYSLYVLVCRGAAGCYRESLDGRLGRILTTARVTWVGRRLRAQQGP